MFSSTKHFEIVNLLIENKASMSLNDKNEKTPYMVAKENRHKKIARLIYEKMIELTSSKKVPEDNAKPTPEISIVTINDEICTNGNFGQKLCNLLFNPVGMLKLARNVL